MFAWLRSRPLVRRRFSASRLRSKCLSWLCVMLARFACADAALARLVLGLCELCLLSGSCLCFLCLLTVCHLQVKRCVNAPPTRLPILVPIAFSRLCLRLASALCPFHFVLHDSGRTDLPRFPCLLPTSCDRGTHVLLTDCLCSGIAESVENVLHIAGLPHRCMTASHLTSV